MPRFLPFIGCFVIGVVIGVILAYGRGARGSSTDWEAKYRDLEQRYRDLTRKLKRFDP